MQRGDTVWEERSGLCVYLGCGCLSVLNGMCICCSSWVFFALPFCVSLFDFTSSSSTFSCVLLIQNVRLFYPTECLHLNVVFFPPVFFVNLQCNVLCFTSNHKHPPPTSCAPSLPMPRLTSAPRRFVGVREYGERNTGRPHSTTWKEF